MGEQDYELGLDDLRTLVARSEYGDAAALRKLTALEFATVNKRQAPKSLPSPNRVL